MESKNSNKKINVRHLTTTAMLAAISWVLYLIQFKIPVVPSFMSMDFSETPAVIASLAMGPGAGVMVCLIKNIMHLLVSRSMWIGELSNFILGVALVVPCGLIYQKKKTRKNAVIALAVGLITMSVTCVFSNYFIVYPLYDKYVLPMEAILAMYNAILPSVTSLLPALIIFNVPFTFVKGFVCALVTFFIYKPLSKIIKNGIN